MVPHDSKSDLPLSRSIRPTVLFGFKFQNQKAACFCLELQAKSFGSKLLTIFIEIKMKDRETMTLTSQIALLDHDYAKRKFFFQNTILLQAMSTEQRIAGS